MEACRCGHGRQWHHRKSGRVRLPCQAMIRTSGGRQAVPCTCRNYVTATPAPARRSLPPLDIRADDWTSDNLEPAGPDDPPPHPAQPMPPGWSFEPMPDSEPAPDELRAYVVIPTANGYTIRPRRAAHL